MPDYPPEVRDRAAQAIRDEYPMMTPGECLKLATLALDAAVPLLADACSRAVLRHSDAHEPKPGSATYLAWHRHFGTAARVAARAFTTREEELRQAAEAIARGDFVRCPSLEEEK